MQLIASLKGLGINVREVDQTLLNFGKLESFALIPPHNSLHDIFSLAPFGSLKVHENAPKAFPP